MHRLPAIRGLTLRNRLVLSLTGIGVLGLLGILWIAWPDPHLIHTVRTNAPAAVVVFSPDGQLLATGARTGQIHVWQVDDGSPLRSMSGHTRSVEALAFSPDGRMLVSGGSDGTVRVWEVATGRMLRILLERHPDPAHAIYTLGTLDDTTFFSVSFSPDGRLVAAGSDHGTTYIIETASGQVLHTLAKPGDSEYMWPVAFSRDGQRIAVGRSDGRVDLWRVQDGQHLQQFKPTIGYSRIYGLSFRPDGATVAAVDATAEVTVWSVATGQVLTSAVVTYRPLLNERALGAQASAAACAAFTPDGQVVAFGAGVIEREYEGIPLIGKRDTRIFVAQAGESEPWLALKGHTDYVAELAFSPSGQLLASVSDDSTIRLWRLRQ